MKLRTILIVLSLLAVLSTSMGGYLYYSSLKESAFTEAQQQAVSRAEAIKNRLSTFLSEQLRPVKALAGLEELQQALLIPNTDTLTEANSILDHFNETLGVNVCYLMDQEGSTIASSNRNDPDSFVGRNYGFRPYFRQAIRGTPTIYMALGVTSGKRGVYYSHPIYGEGGEGKDTPIGIVVIKASTDSIENELSHGYDEIVLLTDPHGIVFISNRRDWLFHTLWKLSSEEIAGIAKTLQFGEGPWNWTGLEIKDNNRAVDKSGNEYLLYQMKIDSFPGWNVIYLRNIKALFKKLSDPLLSVTDSIIFTLCVLIGLSVIFLYKKASHDIVRRKEAEEALRKSEERYRTLYYNTPALLHSIDPKGRLISVSNYWLEALGYERDEVIGRELTDFMTEESSRHAREVTLPEFFRTGFCKDVSYQFVKKNGETMDVFLSAIAERGVGGDVIRSLAILIDVTERKRAEEALNRAKEELSRYSKDLERQVAERTREITSILKNTPAVVYIKDKKYQYVLVNSQFEQLFDIRNEDIRGKTDYDIFPEEIADQFRANDQQVLTEGVPCQVEERVPQEDGAHVYLSVKFPLYDEEGSVASICGISTDITAIMKAQDQLRRLSGSIMASQEKERTAIARELHDELGQVLTALRMDLVWLRERLKETDAKAAELALTMCDLIDKTIDEVRGMATRLRPGVLDDLGLVDALEWYITDFEKRTRIACIFKHLDVPNVNDMVATAVYRIAQEALTNAARHSTATHVDVILKAEKDMLRLSVVDNGRGFNARELTESGCLGIAGMRERANLVGGSVEIQSQSGKGTHVCFTLPVDGKSGAVL